MSPGFSEASGPPFTVTAAGTRDFADPAPWAERFARERAIVCRDVFAPDLLRQLLAAAATTKFLPDAVDGLGTREVESPQRVGGVLNLVLQRPALFEWLGQVTGRKGIKGADGRLVQTRAGAGDALAWHDDLNEPDRLLAVTIGLGAAPYEGGAFELRPTAEPSAVRRFAHDRPGTMLIFDLGKDLEHRVLPVSSGGPRRVFAGWFFARPMLPARMR